MAFADKYISRNIGFPPFIQTSPEHEVKIIVVIPCFNEPDFPDTLKSLASCMMPDCHVEILVVINSPENSQEEVILENNRTKEWISQNQDIFPKWIKTYALQVDNLKKKWAGVGWARKIGMDEAIRRFAIWDNPSGIIVSIDADTVVDSNYFLAIEEYYEKHPSYQFATHYFEHLYDNAGISTYMAYGVVAYELYMRYYRHALRWTGFPHALYTVGSAFSVRAEAYVKQGGMNRKKAGEDFYFLHKLVQLGDYGEIVTTCVYPSCRISNRVPFGTGPMLQSWINGEKDLTLAYHFEAFRELKMFFDLVSELYNASQKKFDCLVTDLPRGIRTFIEHSPGFYQSLSELSSNCSDYTIFYKRFWHFFNAFAVLKYLNFVHSTFYEIVPLAGSVHLLLDEMGINTEEFEVADLSNYLAIFRTIDMELIK